MEKDIDRIAKNAETDIVIRIDDFGGKRGVTIREFVKSERYTGFTKAGTRISADKFKIFKAAISSIDEKDLISDDSDGEIENEVKDTKNQKLTDKKSSKKEDVEELEF